MPKHALVFVHGMGDQTDDWCEPALEILTSAASEYQMFSGTNTPFQSLVQPIGINYASFLVELRNRWKAEMASVKTTLMSGVDADDSAEKQKLGNQFDSVSNAIGTGTDSFGWTHAADVILYRFFRTVRDKINVTVAEQILDKATTTDFSGWSIIAHSLGTAVIHNTLQALYTTPLVAGRPPLRTVQTRPKMLAMVANVSRVLQLPTVKVYSSLVCPGSALLNRACATYLNVRHQWDPFTKPQPFIPDSTWPDTVTFNSTQYQHIRPSHLLLDHLKDVHDLEHYLRNPRVHVPIYRAIFGESIINDTEFTHANTKFDSGILDANTNVLRDQLDKIQPSESDDWSAILALLLKL